MVLSKDILDHNPTGYHILHLEFRWYPFLLEHYNQVRVEAQLDKE